MPHRPPIPSFSALKDSARLPSTAVASTLGGHSGPASRQNTPDNSNSHKQGFSASNFLTVENDGDENAVTPKGFTSHIPAGLQPRPKAADEAMMLTNRLPPNSPVKHQEMYSRSSHGSPRPPHSRRGSRTHRHSASLPSNFDDILDSIPNDGESLVASVKISESRSPSQMNRDSPYHPEFPETEDTDVIIMARDAKTEFYVESRIIFAASPVLADIITSSSEEAGSSTADDDNVYVLEDKFEAVDAMLRFCHPKMAKPSVHSLEHLQRLLKACSKYQIAYGLQNLSVSIVQFAAMIATGKISDSPLKCYALACQFGFPNVAKLVSTYCLSVDPLKSDLGSVFIGVAAKDVRRLFELHYVRALRAKEIVDKGVDAQEMWCDGCAGVPCWYDIFRENALISLKSKPISAIIFSPSFLAVCLKQAAKRCPQCINQYLAPKTQLRLSIMQKEIDELRNQI